MNIRFLQTKGCPNAPWALFELKISLEKMLLIIPVEKIEIVDEEMACARKGSCAPFDSDRYDIEIDRWADPPHFGCRIYKSETGPDGYPLKEMIVAVIKRARQKKIKILFLCTGNSCRSQIAEGWARHLIGDIVEPYSAGIETHGLNQNAVKVMAEAGVDISAHRSKKLDELLDVELDEVITVCDHANETCPIFPGMVKKMHRSFDDPPRLAEGAKTEKEALAHYRRVRDEIRVFVETLPNVLLNGG